MPGQKRYAAVVTIVTLGAVLSPVLRDTDGFPLSNYPMFSTRREADAQIHHVIAWSRDGAHRPVSPEMLGTDEIMQAHQTIKIAVRRGRADALCREVAARVAEDTHAWADVDVLVVRSDRYDAVAYFQDGPKPLSTRVRAQCEVLRGPP